MSQQSIFLPYPQRGLLRTFFRLPLYLYRIGWGGLLRFTSFMVLTTRGNKSGLPRHVVLEYRRHGSKVYAISGWGDRPHWVRNLLADPVVTLQMGGATRCAHAVMVENPAEALRALYMFQRTSRLYEAVLASMSSAESLDLRQLAEVADEFTVVRFDLRPNTPTLPGIHATHPQVGNGLLAAIAALMMGFFWLRRRQTHRRTQEGSQDDTG